MASNLIENIGHSFMASNYDDQAIVDALAPVRECLEGLQTHFLDLGDDEPQERHWCEIADECSPACLKAQEVWKSLET